MTYIDSIVELILVDGAQNRYDDSIHDVDGNLLDVK